jgi:hypothetical protein
MIIHRSTILATAISIAFVAPSISMAKCMNSNAATESEAPIINPAATSTPSVLLGILASGVDADGLTSVASVFGQEETAATVARYAPAAVANEFIRLPVKIAAERSV